MQMDIRHVRSLIDATYLHRRAAPSNGNFMQREVVEGNLGALANIFRDDQLAGMFLGRLFQA